MRPENKIGFFYELLITFVIYVIISFVIITYFFVKMLSYHRCTAFVSAYIFAVLSVFVVVCMLIYYAVGYRRRSKIDAFRAHYINNIIHDFKTPITTISLVNQNVINMRDSYDEDMRSYLDILSKECSALAIMAESITNILRDDAYKIRTDAIIDLHEVLMDCVNRMRFSVAGLGGEIIDELGASSHHVKGNYNMLLSVFINLINNAVKYNDKPPVIKIRTENSNNKVIISVIDNGIGIKEENLDKIFMQSYRVRGEMIGDGLGLGLFFVKDNIERLSGNMLVSSNYGSGSEFRIALPIV